MRYTFVHQHDSTDCAAASLAMVCLHYKKEVTITKLRDMMGTDLKGTNLVGLQKAARELGFDSAAVRVDRENFLSDFTLPCIAQVITKEGLTHFVVVFKKTTIKDDDARHAHVVKKAKEKEEGKKKNFFQKLADPDDFVVIGDPARDLKKISMDEFYETFTGVLLLMNPTSEFKTGKIDKMSMLQRYIDLLMPQKTLFGFAILSSVLLTLIGIVSSLFSKILVDEILPYGLQNMLVSLIIVSTIVSLTQLFIGLARSVIMMYLSIKIDIPLMLGYFSHIFKLPMKFFSTRKTGDITTRYSDAGTIKSILTSIALSVFMDLAMLLISGVILYRMNSTLFGLEILTAIISAILVFIFRQPYKKINEESMQQSAVLNSEMIEGLRGIETIKANAMEDVEMENIEREYIKSMRIGWRSSVLSLSQSTISSLVSTAIGIVVTYVGIMQVLTGEITYGSYMAFSTLAGYFTSPISDFIGLQTSIQEATISMKRLSEILDYETEDQGTEHLNELENISGDIEFKNVTFRYGQRQPALKNISFSIPKGKKVALVGSSGSGKSTVTKLLLKYYEVEDGEITLDGVNINEYSNASVRRAVSYVPQAIELFSKSIFDNIRISKPNATLDEVKEAAKKADAHDFIRKLPLQYNTFLQEAGNGLSGGEKQRIALARAFLKDSGLYIMDESTSNLDFATENTIFDMIYNKLQDRSMLIVAHRLSTVRNCDQILVMDQGEIVERGTHDELLEKKGRYYELWNMQQGNYLVKNTDDSITDVAPTVEVDEDDEEAMTY
jgi:ATP-binding cassette subfamily B protein